MPTEFIDDPNFNPENPSGGGINPPPPPPPPGSPFQLPATRPGTAATPGLAYRRRRLKGRLLASRPRLGFDSAPGGGTTAMAPATGYANSGAGRTAGAGGSWFQRLMAAGHPGSRPAAPAGPGPFGPGNPLGQIDTGDPLAYIRGIPGMDQLLDPNGSSLLFDELRRMTDTNAASAVRRSGNLARARGAGGLPYGVLQAQAERDAYGSGAEGLMSARASSIGRNQDYLGQLMSSYTDFLHSLQSQREGANATLRQSEASYKQQKRLRGRTPLGIGVTGPGGVGVSF